MLCAPWSRLPTLYYKPAGALGRWGWLHWKSEEMLLWVTGRFYWGTVPLPSVALDISWGIATDLAGWIEPPFWWVQWACQVTDMGKHPTRSSARRPTARFQTAWRSTWVLRMPEIPDGGSRAALSLDCCSVSVRIPSSHQMPKKTQTHDRRMRRHSVPVISHQRGVENFSREGATELLNDTSKACWVLTTMFSTGWFGDAQRDH